MTYNVLSGTLSLFTTTASSSSYHIMFSAVLLCPVRGIPTDNNAAGPATARVAAAVYYVQTTLHQHPHALLCHQHGNRKRVCQRTYATAWRGGEVQR